MPNKLQASYKLWKLWFEKHIPFLEADNLVLVGHSLGGMFLIKYLGENDFPHKIQQLHLVSAVLNDEGLNPGDNYLGDFEYNPENIKNLGKHAENITIWHSTDDPVVPFSHAEKIKSFLPDAELMIFNDRKHFSQETFPELIEKIKYLNTEDV